MSKRLDPTRAQLNSTVMIQDIVAILKNPPFNETMTLFSFEEKKEYELLDLIVKVMGMIDTSMKLDNNDTAHSSLSQSNFRVFTNFEISLFIRTSITRRLSQRR